METKPSWKSSEFYITIVATVVGLLMSSGLLSDPNNIWTKAVGMISTALAAMGYSIARGLAKSGVKPDNS